MPFPVAHALVGASVAAALDRRSQSLWKLLCLSALLGVCPDFDYLLNVLRVGRGGWHHGFTHSIMFAMLVGALTALVFGWRSVHGFIVFSAATVSHTLLDYLMTESRGVALWWPFTNYRYKLRVPNPIDYTWDDSSLWIAAADILQISFIELIVFGPLLLLVILVRRYRR
jgi:inner membrane protein